MLARVAEQPTDPNDVWRLISRADDLVKYAPNRDPATARLQARDQLKVAAAAAAKLPDRQAGEALAAQIRTRLEDLDRQDRGED
jgi:hypothetical protein